MNDVIKAAIIIGLVLAVLVALAGLGGQVDRPRRRGWSQNAVLGIAAVLIMIGGLFLFIFNANGSPSDVVISLISVGGGILIIIGTALIGLLLYGILTLMERWANSSPDE